MFMLGAIERVALILTRMQVQVVPALSGYNGLSAIAAHPTAGCLPDSFKGRVRIGMEYLRSVWAVGGHESLLRCLRQSGAGESASIGDGFAFDHSTVTPTRFLVSPPSDCDRAGCSRSPGGHRGCYLPSAPHRCR